MLDEFSVTGGRTFNDCINLSLQLIERNNLQFGGISIIAIVDFLQLPSVMDRSALQLWKKITICWGVKHSKGMRDTRDDVEKKSRL